MVVVTGPSKVGKSRALFEALRGVSEGLWGVSEGLWRPLRVVAPVDTGAVRALLSAGRFSRWDRAPIGKWTIVRTSLYG